MTIILNLIFLGYEDYIEPDIFRQWRLYQTWYFKDMKITLNLIFLGYEDCIEPDIFRPWRLYRACTNTSFNQHLYAWFFLQTPIKIYIIVYMIVYNSIYYDNIYLRSLVWALYTVHAIEKPTCAGLRVGRNRAGVKDPLFSALPHPNSLTHHPTLETPRRNGCNICFKLK